LTVYYAIYEKDKSSVESIGWISLLSLSVFIIAFSVGFGPVPW